MNLVKKLMTLLAMSLSTLPACAQFSRADHQRPIVTIKTSSAGDAALKLRLDEAQHHLDAGNTALNFGHLSDAEDQFLKAYKIWPENGETVLALAHLYQRTGKTNEAAKFWHELVYPQNWGSSVSSDPLVRGEYILLITEHADKSGAAWREAAALYNRTLQQSGDRVDRSRLFDPNRPEYAKLRAQVHAILGTGDYAHGPAGTDKLTHLREAVRTLPNDPTVQLNLGFALEKAGKFEEAAKAFHWAVALHPSDQRTALLAEHHARDVDWRVQMIKHPVPAWIIEDDKRTHNRK